MDIAQAINGEIACFDLVISTSGSDYPFLVGEVNAVEKLGSPEHDSGNPTDDVFVDFQAEEYSKRRITEIEEYFSNLYGEPKRFEDLPLDNVIMCPDSLIRISESDLKTLLESREAAKAYCDEVLGSPHKEKQGELMERLDANLADYRASLMDFGKSELIDMVGAIAAMTDTHSYLTTSHGFDDNEIEYLLQFQNPLEVVADEWRRRIEDSSDIAFALNEVFDKQNALKDYPLMSDSPVNTDLRRFMNVDLIDFLGKIAEKTIIHYPNDWNTDIKALYSAAGSENPEDRWLMWHVSSWGTHLNTERDTFIKDTGAFNTWVDYRPSDPDMFGYVIEVIGRDGQIITGNVFEVGDYYAHSLYVRENALICTEVSLTYSNDWGVNAGKTITVPRFEYDDDRHRLMSESGNVTAIRYHPYEGVREMSALLHGERSRRMSYPLGSTDAHLRRLTKTLSEIRTTPEPPAPKRKQSLEEKLNVAGEKVKAQGVPNNITKSHNRDERS